MIRPQNASPVEQAHARGLKEGAARKKARILSEQEKRERLALRYRAAVGLVKRLVLAVDANDYTGWHAEGPAAEELDAAIVLARKRHRIPSYKGTSK